MLLISVLLYFIGASQAISCKSDNCLNAFIHTSSLAKPFCATYTKTSQTSKVSLPAYATACTNNLSRISSACSCLATASSTLATSIHTTSSPASTATCHPGPLKDPTFGQTVAGGNEWVVTVNQAPGQAVTPLWSFPGTTPASFAVEFPNLQSDPFLSTVTLSQPGLHVCNGHYHIAYTYWTMINAIAANPVPQISNCTITSGFTDIPASLRVTPLPWETANQSPSDILFEYGFDVAGLPAVGADKELYFIFQCALDDWWPRTYFSAPGIAFG